MIRDGTIRAPGVQAAPAAEPAEIGLVVEAFAARARRRLAWLDAPAADEPEGDPPEAEIGWQQGSEDGRRHGAAVAAADAALAAAQPCLDRIVETFGLGEDDRHVLLAALALRLEPGLSAGVQRLTGRPWATEPLVQRLFGHGRRPVWNASGPLAAWSLVSEGDAAPGEPPPLVVDPAIPFWLCGETPSDPGLAGHVELLVPPAPLETWPVAAIVRSVLDRWRAARPVRLVVEGATGSGRASFAAAVASRLGQSAVIVSAVTAGPQWPRLLMLVRRNALIAGTMPIWRAPPPARPRTLPVPPLQAVTVEPETAVDENETVYDIRIALPPFGRDVRLALLPRLVPAAATWPVAQRVRIVDRPGMVVGDLAGLARRCVTCVAEADACLRAGSAERLGDLAERVEAAFDWDDLILPTSLLDSLRDFAFEARGRSAFWERPEVLRLFARGRGLVALFAGPPGTGKTMAAQIIARAIGVEVFRIDLATLVSKYIGETAKNLRQIFRRSAGMDVLLLFDEADALFASRTEVKDAHDRYANTDTNYLLQLLEGFDGIAILATNRKANIDTAFLRRIRYVFDFPRPGLEERRRLWHALAPPILGVEPGGALGSMLDRLGDGMEMSGAQIKNALVAGHFVAQRRGAGAPEAQDLIRGIERELAKEGRALTPRDRRRLAGDA